MSTIFWIAWRYLWGRRNERFVWLLSFISIAGVGIGVAALIVVLAVMSGFDKDLKEKIVGNYSHITVSSASGEIPDYQKVIQDVLELKHIVAASAYVQFQALLQTGAVSRGIVVKGIDFDSEAKVTRIDNYLVAGQKTLKEGIFIGKELSYALGLGLEDELTLVGPQGKKYTLKITGLFNSGIYDYDTNMAFIGLSKSQEISGIGEKVNGISIRVDKLFLADTIKQEVMRVSPPAYYAHTWMERNKNFFAALKLEKITMFIILTLIILVAAFNIIGTLVVMVTEKTKDIGILKAIGMNKRRIRIIFTLEGLLIGVIGIAGGGSLGVALCMLLKKYKFIKLPADIYYLDRLPVSIELWPDITVILFAAFIICLLSTLYPSKKAAGLTPVEALRYE